MTSHPQAATLLHFATGHDQLGRYKFRYGGKENLLALGDYPRISVVGARRRHKEALSLLDHSLS